MFGGIEMVEEPFAWRLEQKEKLKCKVNFWLCSAIVKIFMNDN